MLSMYVPWNTLLTWIIYVEYMDFTTVNISQVYLGKLGELAIKDKRSKTSELHYLIDKELEAQK